MFLVHLLSFVVNSSETSVISLEDWWRTDWISPPSPEASQPSEKLKKKTVTFDLISAVSGRAGNESGGQSSQLLPEDAVTARFDSRRDKANPRWMLRPVATVTLINKSKSCWEIDRLWWKKAPSCRQHWLLIAAATTSLTVHKSAQTVTVATGRRGESEER